MNNQSIIYLIATSIEIWQSFAFGILILFIANQNKKQMRYFAVYLLFNGLSCVPDMFNLVLFEEQNSFLILLSAVITLFSFATFYHYINLLLVKNNDTLYKIIMYSILSISFFGISLIFNTQNRLVQVHESISYLFRYVIFIVIIIQLIIHNREVKNQYSNTNNRELKLVLYIIIGAVLLPLLSMALSFSDNMNIICISIYVLLLQLALIYTGIYYKNSTDLFVVKQNTTPLTNEKQKSIKDTVPQTDNSVSTSELFKQIQSVIIDKQLFLKPELTIADVANEISEHPKTTSQIINTNANQNFNTYINSFRVIHAKMLLKNPKNKHITIEEIGKMAGFRSNSVFYTKFKNTLNITPLQFQKNQQSN